MDFSSLTTVASLDRATAYLDQTIASLNPSTAPLDLATRSSDRCDASIFLSRLGAPLDSDRLQTQEPSSNGERNGGTSLSRFGTALYLDMLGL